MDSFVYIQYMIKNTYNSDFMLLEIPPHHIAAYIYVYLFLINIQHCNIASQFIYCTIFRIFPQTRKYKNLYL